MYNINFWLTGAPGLSIYFSPDAGKSWELLASVPSLPTYYEWTVPNIVSDSCLVMVGDYPCIYDVSDSYFSIVQITPVELLSFSSSVVDDGVTLIWTTATETNNSGFQVERRETKNKRSDEWNNIGFVNGNGTTTETKSFSYKDENLSSGKYQYRLKQIDFDGTFKYSNIVEAVILPPAKFSLEQNYPNPFNPSTNIQYSISSRQFVQLKVYDVLGNQVATIVDEEMPAGSHKIDFTSLNLSSGIYFYRLTAGEFVQTKKMVLLK